MKHLNVIPQPGFTVSPPCHLRLAAALALTVETSSTPSGGNILSFQQFLDNSAMTNKTQLDIAVSPPTTRGQYLACAIPRVTYQVNYNLK